MCQPQICAKYVFKFDFMTFQKIVTKIDSEKKMLRNFYSLFKVMKIC